VRLQIQLQSRKARASSAQNYYRAQLDTRTCTGTHTVARTVAHTVAGPDRMRGEDLEDGSKFEARRGRARCGRVSSGCEASLLAWLHRKRKESRDGRDDGQDFRGALAVFP
jgi:hypothetical protein